MAKWYSLLFYSRKSRAHTNAFTNKSHLVYQVFLLKWNWSWQLRLVKLTEIMIDIAIEIEQLSFKRNICKCNWFASAILPMRLKLCCVRILIQGTFTLSICLQILKLQREKKINKMHMFRFSWFEMIFSSISILMFASYRLTMDMDNETIFS